MEYLNDYLCPTDLSDQFRIRQKVGADGSPTNELEAYCVKCRKWRSLSSLKRVATGPMNTPVSYL